MFWASRAVGGFRPAVSGTTHSPTSGSGGKEAFSPLRGATTRHAERASFVNEDNPVRSLCEDRSTHMYQPIVYVIVYDVRLRPHTHTQVHEAQVQDKSARALFPPSPTVPDFGPRPLRTPHYVKSYAHTITNSHTTTYCTFLHVYILVTLSRSFAISLRHPVTPSDVR